MAVDEGIPQMLVVLRGDGLDADGPELANVCNDGGCGSERVVQARAGLCLKRRIDSRFGGRVAMPWACSVWSIVRQADTL